ncbi:DNA repair protein RecN [Vineibacter terrae]|uniref:DNA repair protein RecN n=1 Tax=Vineibacter terrae TaxID=2586908 RepID=UPI002E2ED178|nr:DNA repair protein RecN [Vineibacter terrae]HEX2889450.1 DNA repair protein RecN [Vineibacter terrae]
MLLGLSIRDFVLIEKLDLAFPVPGKPGTASGLGVLTGETGAGKSILLDAFSLSLGGRAGSGIVRPGAAQAVVGAEFSLADDHPAHAILAEQGIVDEGATLLLRRLVGADGRGRAFVNDQPTSIGLLKRLGETLVEIQGQFEQHGLLVPVNHRATLDAFGGLGADAAKVEAAWNAWRAAEAARQSAAAAFEQARREEEYLRHAVAELEGLAPKADDEERLAAERQLLRHGAAVGEAVVAALAELEHDKGGAAALRHAHRLIERQAAPAGGRLDAALSALERALSETTEAAAQLEQARDALDADPARLEKIEERLFALRAAARKHGTTVGGLAGLRERMAEQLAALDDGDARQRALAAQATQAREAFVAAARALSAGRAKAATRLDRTVSAELPPLKLERAKFVTRLEAQAEKDWGSHGTDRVEFLVATNPGMAPGPIGKIASGGELSRFMLALKLALAKVGDARTLVFDEVDSGIGGATAAAVGDRLRRLARSLQVLVVTHSPQVAALADHHWLIRKTTGRAKAASEVVALDRAARLEEVARMLSGAAITDAARAAARQLMTAGK